MAMSETLTPEGTVESLDIETLRSQLKALSEKMWIDAISDAETYSDSKRFLEDCFIDLQNAIREIESEDPSITSLSLGDSDGRYPANCGHAVTETYLEQLKEEFHLVKDENKKNDDEIASLKEAVHIDSAELDGGLEGLGCSLKLRDLWSNNKFQGDRSNGGCESIYRRLEGIMTCARGDKFKILELSHQIEKSNNYLMSLEDLSYVFRRDEAMKQMEDILSEEVLPIEIEGNCIRLLIKTPIPGSDGLLIHQKLDCAVEPSVLDHELLIEVMDETKELKNVAIFPNDISLDEVISAAKLSREFFSSVSVPMVRSSFKWLVQKVQQQILFSTLRNLVVKDANKSRHSFEYSDRDATVTVHFVGGIDAFIKVPQGWPVSYPLELVSIRNLDIHSKSFNSIGSLCKIKELANSLDERTRRHLPSFADAIEEIVIREMRPEH